MHGAQNKTSKKTSQKTTTNKKYRKSQESHRKSKEHHRHSKKCRHARSGKKKHPKKQVKKQQPTKNIRPLGKGSGNQWCNYSKPMRKPWDNQTKPKDVLSKVLGHQTMTIGNRFKPSFKRLSKIASK